MTTLDNLLKNLGKRIVRRKLQRSLEELIPNVNMRLYLAGNDNTVPVKESTRLERIAINHADSIYNLIEKILPKRYLVYGEGSLDKPAFPNSNYQ